MVTFLIYGQLRQSREIASLVISQTFGRLGFLVLGIYHSGLKFSERISRGDRQYSIL
jgi:hypothetical protein